MKKKLSLPQQIIIALILGVVVGLVCYFTQTQDFTKNFLKPFGDIFVNLLKFIVVPGKTVGYFMGTTAVACIIGLVLANVFLALDLFPNLTLGDTTYTAKQFDGFMSVLIGIFPTNMWSAFVNANMLQVIVIALFLGGAMLAAGEKSQMCRDFVDSAYAVIEQLMAFIISLSPIGVFTYMAWVTATQGASILGSLALVLLCAYVGYFLHAIIVYSFSAKVFAGLSPVAFFKGAVPAMIFAFTSASSTATLPVSKECADNMGADKDISSFVLPLGATVHMDGTAIYMCVATVFLATCAGVQLTLTQLIMVVAIATLSAIGTAGTPGAGVIMLTMVLGTVGIPVDYIGLIIAVDRLFDMGRTTMNITGDIAGALCVTKWTNGKLSNNK